MPQATLFIAGAGRARLHSRLLALLAATCLAAGLAADSRGEIKVDSLFPPSVAVGASVEVAAAGTFDQWPVRIQIEGGPLAVEPLEKKGRFRVTAAADAPTGLRWLRVVSDEGGSRRVPLLVGGVPEQLESEPNDGREQSSVVAMPRVVIGKLNKTGDVDSFRIHLKRRQRLVAAVDAQQLLGSPMDAVLQVCDEQGFVLQQVDDARGTDPRLVFDAPDDGDFLVRLFGFPGKPNSSIALAGGPNYVYRLTLTSGPFLEHCWPLPTQSDAAAAAGTNLDTIRRIRLRPPLHGRRWADAREMAGWAQWTTADDAMTVYDSSLAATPVDRLPAVLVGCISEPQQRHRWTLPVRKGQKLRLKVTSAAWGFPLDAVLAVYDGDNKLLKEVDDVSRKPDPELQWTAPADGVVHVEVRDLHDRGGPLLHYQLHAGEVRASCRLSVAGDAFELAGAGKLEIPVTVSRDNGFTESLRIRAVNLPEGVTSDAAESAAKGDTAKQVMLTLRRSDAADKLLQGEFSIAAETADGKTLFARLSLPTPGGEARTFWLTAKPK